MAEQRLSEQLAVVACIDPDAYTTGAATSDEIDMRYHDRVVFIVMAGTLGSSATLDFKLQGCATSGGSFSDISGFTGTRRRVWWKPTPPRTSLTVSRRR